MSDSTNRPGGNAFRNLLAVLAITGLIGVLATRRSAPETSPRQPASAVELESWAAQEATETTQRTAEAIADTEQTQDRNPPRPPEPNAEAIARAEAERERARRERTHAEQLVEQAESELRRAELDAAQTSLASRGLPGRLRDPRARFATARTRGAVLQSEIETLHSELRALAQAPRPRRKILSDRTPVARPVDGKEFHFEVRGDRVAFIDLERLVDKLEADAKLQIRLSRGTEPRIRSTVGPVGDFSLSYTLSSALPGSVDALLGLSVSYDLVGWELIPERPTRGETLNTIRHPASVFGQVVNTLSPGHATITLWVYPNGFATYREIQSLLHARGFEVAARPLPEGIPIRGSPNGSLSAGQ